MVVTVGGGCVGGWGIWEKSVKRVKLVCDIWANRWKGVLGVMIEDGRSGLACLIGRGLMGASWL